MSHHDGLLRKLSSIGPLLEEDRQALAALPLTVRTASTNTDISREGHKTNDCCVLLAGVACRYRVYKSGQRQIMSLHVMGDLLDLDALYLGVTDYSIAPLTPVKLGLIPRAALRELLQHRPGVAQAFWMLAMAEAAMFREWLANIGRRSARERVAHLICEIFARAHVLGLADGYECEFPITQAEMADALGLSTVHVNRVLQDLRAEGLLTLACRRVTIHDWDDLKHVADFQPGYLHLQRPLFAPI